MQEICDGGKGDEERGEAEVEGIRVRGAHARRSLAALAAFVPRRRPESESLRYGTSLSLIRIVFVNLEIPQFPEPHFLHYNQCSCTSDLDISAFVRGIVRDFVV